MKKSNFEEALASDMDAILTDKNFEAIFKKASVLTKEASEEMCAEDCKMDHDHKKEDKKPDADVAKADDGSTLTLEAAVSQALNNLMKVSEVLDEVGLEKTAALSLNLANYIIVEAKKKDEKKKSDKKKTDDENDAKKKPAKKDDKKSDKKDDKKSDKKENPFAKKENPFAKKK